jgi:hypothetical protein
MSRFDPRSRKRRGGFRQKQAFSLATLNDRMATQLMSSAEFSRDPECLMAAFGKDSR